MKSEEIVRIAKGDIGKSRDEVGCPGDYAWCAAWASSVLNRAGVGDGVTSTSCTLMQRYMSENKDWDEPEDYPKPGDIIFFGGYYDWQYRTIGHVAIYVGGDTIVHASGGGFGVIESNYTDRRQSIVAIARPF